MMNPTEIALFNLRPNDKRKAEMTLRWHMWQRQDFGWDEYATDSAGRPAYLIQSTSEGGWILHKAITFNADPLNLVGIEWDPVWEFDTLKQARHEAEIRQRSSGGRE